MESKIRNIEEIDLKLIQLKKDKDKFTEFLKDIYGDKECKNKINAHIWRINREIEILEWVLNKELPF